MTELEFHNALLWVWFGLAAVTFAALQWTVAPYGRHVRGGWGPQIPSVTGWVVMELPAVVVPLTCFALSERRDNPVLWVFLGAWLLHYVHRTFIFPFRMRMRGKQMPALIAALAFVTNVAVNYLVARWLFTLGPTYDERWLRSMPLLVGSAVFLVGFMLNVHSDDVLRRLRAPGETGYKIPRAGAWRWVSSPNYLGEIIEWAGFALMTLSMPALAFLVWTMSNLLPRAASNHRWYRETFDDYPRQRKALIPGIW